MKKVVLLSFLLFTSIAAKAERLLTTLYPRNVLEAVIVEPGHFAPVPDATTDFWKKTVPVYMRHSYINNGKSYLGKPWTPIPSHIFQEYHVNGNRTNYENRSFKLRRQLACIVMAEIMQDSGKFIDDIVKGLRYFMDETWWGVPAHYPKPLIDPSLQEVDLFNAETANLLSWTCYMLEKRIQKKDRRICQDIRHEIKRRVLIPARTTDYFWKRHSWNHNTWICASWLACILFCEDNRQQQIDDICQVLKSLDIFVDGYPADGGCDEGPNYWDRATGSLFECLQLLSLASKGKVAFPLTEKTRAMANYILSTYIGNGYYVNFADCNSRLTPNINILYPLGATLNDKAMMRHAAYIAKKNEYFAHPWKLFNPSGVFPSLGRELCFLRLLPAFRQEKAEEVPPASSCLPDTEVLTARTTRGLFLAAKGGHNDESHNHNDIGNFIVYADGTPLIIDIGMGTYTRQTFSQGRYDLLYCRSAYHNVPLINGFEQHEGRRYKAKSVKYSNQEELTQFSLDLSDAYPQETSVRKWKRTILLDHNKGITITEDFNLSKYIQPTDLIIVCCGKPSLRENNKILIANGSSFCHLIFDHHKLSASFEKIDHQDPAIQNAWDNKELYRIKLRVLGRSLKNKISYSIRKG